MEPLTEKPRTDFRNDPYLRDIVERNLEVAAQAVIDICHRALAVEGASSPEDYRDAILRAGEIGLIDTEFAEELAPLAGFRNILAHQYAAIDWDLVYQHLQKLDVFDRFASAVREWLEARTSESS
ncbi:MAG: DUF86 domain-containing protein [Bradymonadaceae bacterium]